MQCTYIFFACCIAELTVPLLNNPVLKSLAQSLKNPVPFSCASGKKCHPSISRLISYSVRSEIILSQNWMSRASCLLVGLVQLCVNRLHNCVNGACRAPVKFELPGSCASQTSFHDSIPNRPRPACYGHHNDHHDDDRSGCTTTRRKSVISFLISRYVRQRQQNHVETIKMRLKML